MGREVSSNHQNAPTMKNLFLLMTLFFVFIAGTFAQNGATQPVYNSGFHLLINGGMYALSSPRSTTVPKTIGVEVAFMKDISAGLLVTHYTFKNQEPYEKPDDNYATNWVDDSTLYTHLFYGLKGSYHLNSILANSMNIYINPRRWDLAISGMVGRNSVQINSSNGDASVDDILNADIDTESKLRGGGSISLRYFYSNSLSFFVDLGISHYGMTSFGLAYSPL